MAAKAYSSFFFPEVNQPSSSSFRGRSFLSFDNADSFKEDDERSIFTTATSTTVSTFLLDPPASQSERVRPRLHSLHTSRIGASDSPRPSSRPIPQAKPAPKVHPPVPPSHVPCSAPPERTEYRQHMGTRHYTSPSKPKIKKHVREQPVPMLTPPSPPPSPQSRRVSTSTVSTGYRKATRAHALASLEGRTPLGTGSVAPSVPPSAIPLNARSFIPLSKHDDDAEDYDPDLESEADDPTPPRKAEKAIKRQRRRTIDSWFIGPPPSRPPSPSASSTAPSFTHDSDESFESPRPSLSSAEPSFQVPQRGQVLDFGDVNRKTLQQFEYDAWGVVGEQRPEWLRAVLG